MGREIRDYGTRLKKYYREWRGKLQDKYYGTNATDEHGNDDIRGMDKRKQIGIMYILKENKERFKIEGILAEK